MEWLIGLAFIVLWFLWEPISLLILSIALRIRWGKEDPE